MRQGAVQALKKRLSRIFITLLPVLLALLHVTGVARWSALDGLDYFIYDWRLRAAMPEKLDPRIVIVDIDDASLEQFGQWPWGRDRLAQLTRELTERQDAAVVGFDAVFPEPDRSTGLATLRELAQGPLSESARLAKEIEQLAPLLDHDQQFANAMAGHNVVLGYYFTRTPRVGGRGELPAPALPSAAVPLSGRFGTRWSGYGGNIAPIAQAASTAGFINAGISFTNDGVLRAAPLLAHYDDGLGEGGRAGYYESLGLAVFRLATGMQGMSLALAPHPFNNAIVPAMAEALILDNGEQRLRIPVDALGRMLVPFRGHGGPQAGTFRYVPAADVLDRKLAPGELAGKIVLVGATAPGLQDLRATPVNVTFPGVEVHANVISALLDQRLLTVPDYVLGYEAMVVLVAGLLLAVGLSVLPVARAVLWFVFLLFAVVGLDTLLYLRAGLVLPLASALAMMAFCFAINMSWGYLVEARSRRGLATLFGTYVPPELVEKMLERPGRYSMRAESKELTAMFCDMRGFTNMAENMAPLELQALLNTVFSRLTEVISRHGGTIDKYMGDCVMAFWGAPVDIPDHAARAVRAAIEMNEAIAELNARDRGSGRPPVQVGIGLSTGVMSVGDMGSAVRRSYTVIGDAVNLASRLEGLCAEYGVAVVASAATMQAAPEFAWMALDRVVVRGRLHAVDIFTPEGAAEHLDTPQREELANWHAMLAAYRAQDPERAQNLLSAAGGQHAKKVLYQLYADRIASMRLHPFDADWDGATRFPTK